MTLLFLGYICTLSLLHIHLIYFITSCTHSWKIGLNFLSSCPDRPFKPQFFTELSFLFPFVALSCLIIALNQVQVHDHGSHESLSLPIYPISHYLWLPLPPSLTQKCFFSHCFHLLHVSYNSVFQRRLLWPGNIRYLKCYWLQRHSITCAVISIKNMGSWHALGGLCFWFCWIPNYKPF